MKAVHYQLTILTSFPDSFIGSGEISLLLDEPACKIVVNTARPLEVKSVVVVAGGRRYSVAKVETDDVQQTTLFSFAEEIPRGEAVLGLVWTGRLDDGNSLGYYHFSPANDPESHCAVTQFQPSLARRAFPCFDHPAKKATFQLTLVVPKDLTALSNTAELSRSRCEGALPTTSIITAEMVSATVSSLSSSASEIVWESVRFETTPRMSTYLVAWALGKFSKTSAHYVSPLTQTHILLSVYATAASNVVEQGLCQLALETLAEVMPIYELMFGIPYPMSKLDVLACELFDAGAMENMGLITGRTSLLLHDTAASGVSAMIRTVVTIGHEAAHMWFGNIVTPRWWDELWLNEGFATLMGEVLVLDKIHPEWRVHAAFVKFHRVAAMELDALESSHPVHMICGDDLEATISQSFDSISYEKGSAILKMLSNFIGEAAFLEATSQYLTRHLFDNSTGADLWRAMSETSGLDIVGLMQSWTTQTGFPVVVVEDTPTGLRLRQKRFLSSTDAIDEEDSTLWCIPLDLRILGGTDQKAVPIIMDTREMDVPMAKDALYVLNSEASGFYRVSYPADHLSRLTSPSAFSSLSLADRLGILQDVVSLGEAGYTSSSDTLSYILRLSKSQESEFLVWSEVSVAIDRLRDAFWEQSPDLLEGLNAFARSLFTPLVNTMGFAHHDEDDTDRRLFRVVMIRAAASAEDPRVISQLTEMFSLLAAGQLDPASADLTSVIVPEAVKHGGEREFQIALAIYNNPPTPQHQIAAISGLTATRSIERLGEVAGMLGGGAVQDNLVPIFIDGLSSNPVSRRMLWSIVKAAWPVLEAKLAGSMALGTVVQQSFQRFSSEDDAAEVEAFFADKDSKAFKQGLEQGLESVRSRARWIGRDATAVRAWLSANKFLPES